MGGARFVLWLFFFPASSYVLMHSSGTMSLCPLKELEALLFFCRGGLGGYSDEVCLNDSICRSATIWFTLPKLPLRPFPPTELLAMLMQLTPFSLRGFRTFLFWLLPICDIRLWYKVAAITIASSGDWQTNAWHSSWRGTSVDRITTEKIGACNPDDNRRLSATLKRKSIKICIL